MQLIINSTISGAEYALLGIGFTIIFGTVRIFHIAHGVIFMLGAYTAYLGLLFLRLNMVTAFLFAMVVCAICGILVDQIAYRPLRARQAPPLGFLISSLGVYFFIQNSVALVLGSDSKSLRAATAQLRISEGYNILGGYISSTQIVILIVVGLLVFLLQIFLKFTKPGTGMRAMSDNVFLTEVVGIEVEKIIIITYGIGSALAGAAGVLIALEEDLNPSMGFVGVIKGCIIAIIGGIGNIPGALVAGVLLGVAENFGTWPIASSWKYGIAFIALLIILFVRPMGIFGVKTFREEI
jgi:branched-chain amino acid transport system permease protein